MSPGAFLVTGGSSGIGAVIAMKIASAGHHVGIVGRRSLRDHGAPDRVTPPGVVDWIEADLTQGPETREAIQRWSNCLPRALDGVVLSAVSYGHGARHPFLETSLEEWDEILAVNLRGPFVVASAVLPTLLARPRAFILAISSIAAIEPAPGRTPYAASKAGALALFRGLAEELRETAVSLVQAMPRNQVVTPGLRARRPLNYSFEGYDSPDIFEPITAKLLAGLGNGFHGSVLAINSDGSWENLQDRVAEFALPLVAAKEEQC